MSASKRPNRGPEGGHQARPRRGGQSRNDLAPRPRTAPRRIRFARLRWTSWNTSAIPGTRWPHGRAAKPGAHVVASIPNVQNIEVLQGLARGAWDYAGSGLLDVTHLRFSPIAASINCSPARASPCNARNACSSPRWTLPSCATRGTTSPPTTSPSAISARRGPPVGDISILILAQKAG